jgi:hypothetical protein
MKNERNDSIWEEEINPLKSEIQLNNILKIPETNCISITKTYRLIISRETIAIYLYETEKNTCSGQSAEVFNAKSSVTCIAAVTVLCVIKDSRHKLTCVSRNRI